MYQFLGAQTSFAQHGLLAVDYPADTALVDRRGFTVQLDGLDQVMEEQTLFSGLSDSMLAFIGGEVMSIVGATLLGSGRYRLPCIRGRFNSAIEAHAAGADVFIIPRIGLKPLQHPHFQAGNNVQLKVAPFTASAVADLSNIDPTALAVQGRAISIGAPARLRVNGMTVNAGFDAAVAMDIDWVLPEATGLDMSRAYTLLEFLEAGVVTYTQQVAWPGNTLSYTYPAIPAQFTLRASVAADSGWQTISGRSISINVFNRTSS